MTLAISSELEKELLERAADEGADPNAMAEALLAAALKWQREDFEEAVQGIQRGFDAFEKGHFRPLEDFAAEQREKYAIPRDK